MAARTEVMEMSDMRALVVAATGLIVLLAAACGGADEATASLESGGDGRMARGETVVVERVVVKEVPVEVVVEREVIKEVEVPGETVVVEEVVTQQVLKAIAVAGPAGAAGPAVATWDTTSGQPEGQQADLVAQRRIIVRTVDMTLEVPDVAGSVDAIGDMAEELGGWVVYSDRSRKHRGAISVRVLAKELDQAVERLRAMASKVNFEVSTSRDVTDEFVDTTARLTNLKATEAALISLLERAGDVEDLLKVQQELTRVQEEMERLQGRIKFLEQTSAYSLINVSLELAPMDMAVDPGAPKTFSVGQVARFRASFRPPAGIDEFQFTWDFGDGSEPISGRRTAPALEEGTRFTATVNHVYSDDRDSPFIAEVEVTGTGDAGVAKGIRTVVVTVTEVPTIEVFAGNHKDVEERETVEFSGSFTRPEGLRDLSYEWDFGDGTLPATVSLAAGVTNAVASHEYADHRPFPYTATLTIRAQSDAGEVETSSSIQVYVQQDKGWVIAGWSVADQGKAAVRSLSAVGLGAGTFLVWMVIFSPVWVVVVAVVIVARRRIRRRSSFDEADGGSVLGESALSDEADRT